MLGDTIFAIASPPGASSRGLIRLSGPQAFELAERVTGQVIQRKRGAFGGRVSVLGQPVACLVLTMPGPASFTGEDCLELHLPGSPLLLEAVLVTLRESARDALPGEFTRRAFEHGRLDLSAAEAVLDLIHSATVEERRHALHVLGGGLAAAVDNCRSRVQDALALLEAGLDFSDGETGAVATDLWLPTLLAVHTQLEELLCAIPATRAGGDLLLLGATNAGKSALCNALAERDAVLVSACAGTTRDVIAIELGQIRLLDAPGDLPLEGGDVHAEHDRAAIALRDRVAEGVAAVVVVLDLSAVVLPQTGLPVAMVVFTKADLIEAPMAIAERYAQHWPEATRHFVSALSGEGIDALRRELLERQGHGPQSGGHRLADRLSEAVAPLVRAITAANEGDLAEVIALDLQMALSALDAVHGRSSPEQLLDRIFGRFCLGK